MPRVSWAAPLLGLLLVTACADLKDEIDEIAGDDDDRGPRMVTYQCDDDRDFIARFSGDRDNVEIDSGGRRFDLEYTDRDDGKRVYTNGDDVELRVDDDEAYLRIPGESDFKDCERS